MSRTTEDPSLFPEPRHRSTFGPIYQGVAKQIRTLVKAETIDKDEHAGTIAQARSLAASIDRVSGHTNPKSQASGMQLAAMHSELRELLERLSPDTDAGDPFQQLLDEMSQEGARSGHAQAPHEA